MAETTNPNNNGTPGAQTPPAAAAETPVIENFEEWLGGQSDDVRDAYQAHTRGLKSALDSEREQRRTVEKQLREMAQKSEKGSDAQTKLTEMADQLESANEQAEFYDAAHRAGVSNLKLAYMIARQDGLFDKRGQVNFEAMKNQYPELFPQRPVTPKGNAGAGRESPGAKTDMNQFIRRQAGRR